jgi:hypothetical protein
MDKKYLNSNEEQSIPVARRIYTVNWSVLPSHFREQNYSALVAIWPTPCPLCACMKRAGIYGESKINEEWDAEWRQMVQRLLICLERFGEPSMRSEVKACEIVKRSGFAAILDYFPFSLIYGASEKKLTLSILEQLLLTMDDDQFGEAIVNFGNTPNISLSVGYGHHIFWLTFFEESGISLLDPILSFIADGRKLANTEVDWNAFFNDLR